MEAHDSTAFRFTVRTMSKGGGLLVDAVDEVDDEALWSA
jgi:hypothetical protein